jgi:hypothetical protein
MSEAVDYFANHRHKLRFPWSLYHQPIISALEAALGASTGPEVLNVGSGPFFELTQIDAREKRVTLCDIDSRSIDSPARISSHPTPRFLIRTIASIWLSRWT